MPRLRDFFAKNLHRYLAERGKKAEFLRRSGISPNSLRAWLDGESVPDLDSLQRIADALRISPLELLCEPGTAPSHPIEECHRRIGEAIRREEAFRAALHGNVPPEFEARVLKALLAGLERPAKKTGD